MRSRLRGLIAVWVAALAWAASAPAAHGAVFRDIAFYTGGSITAPTSVVIDQEGHGTTTIQDVRFLNKPFVPPPYYGVRVRWDWPSPMSRLDRVGTEFEFVHFKIYYESGDDPDGVIQRFDATDGLNLFYVNAVGSVGLQEGFLLSGRVGVGPVVSHPETEIRNQKKGSDGDWRGYEYSGITWQAGVALEKSLAWPARGSRAFLEYKFTAADPKIGIAGGSATTSVRAHHFVVGWSVRL